MSFLKKNVNVVEAVENMELMGAGIGNILYLPTVNTSIVPQIICDFLEDVDVSNIDQLEAQMPGIKKSIESYSDCSSRERSDFAREFISILHQNCNYPYLVEIQICKGIRSVSMSDDKVKGWGGSWSSYTTTWVLVESVEQAIQKAIELGEQNLLDYAMRSNTAA